MAEERVQRRLAAILAADVVGYSRMMSHDEVGKVHVSPRDESSDGVTSRRVGNTTIAIRWKGCA